MADTLAGPTHKNHVANLSSTMQKVNLSHVDRSEKDRNRRPLHALKNTIDLCPARHLLPKSRRRSFANHRITVRGGGDLEWRPVRPTPPHRSAVTV